MKRYCVVKSLIIIVALLTSQLGNAFAFAPPMQDCGMEMSSNTYQSSHEMTTDMAKTMSSKHHSPSQDNMPSQMDCCDMTATMSCCEEECQCSSLITASAFVSNSSLTVEINSQLQPSILFMTTPLGPFLHQPKRPPINYIS